MDPLSALREFVSNGRLQDVVTVGDRIQYVCQSWAICLLFGLYFRFAVMTAWPDLQVWRQIQLPKECNNHV